MDDNRVIHETEIKVSTDDKVLNPCLSFFHFLHPGHE